MAVYSRYDRIFRKFVSAVAKITYNPFVKIAGSAIARVSARPFTRIAPAAKSSLHPDRGGGATGDDSEVRLRAGKAASSSRMRKKSVLAKLCVEYSDATHATVAEDGSANRFARRFWRFLPRLGRFRAWLRNSLHQLGQPDQVVGSGRQREHPADASQATVMGLAKAGGRLEIGRAHV